MPEVKKYGSVKRFGPRYGRRIKDKVALIEELARKKHKCPYCKALKVKRVAAGIWNCNKCGAKYAGSAYYPEEIVLRKKLVEKEERVTLRKREKEEEAEEETAEGA